MEKQKSNFLCKLAGHKWDGCRCARCGTNRNEEHKWNGCKCTVCGRLRDEDHSWDGCKCTICGKLRHKNHKLAAKRHSCSKVCTVCGFETAPEHTWNGCKCTVCGLTRDRDHKWADQGCVKKCSICGKKTEKHDYKLLRENVTYGKCQYLYYSDKAVCSYCDTPNACTHYPIKTHRWYKCSRCGHEYTE